MDSRTFKRRVLLPLLTLGITLLAIELVLQAFAFLAPRYYELLRGTIAVSVPDPRLGTRPNPAHPEHDERGFRNASIPSKVAIVGMGDSQTYGLGVRREAAWPQQLETLVRQPVYNVANPGWGPTQSLLLFDEVLALEPRLIIQAFYSGNDFYDAYVTVYDAGQFPELRTTNPRDSSLIAAAGTPAALKSELGEIQAAFRRPWARPAAGPPGVAGRTKRWLDEHLGVYQMLRGLRNRVRARFTRQSWGSERRFAEALGDRDVSQIVEQGDLKTILLPRYRWALLNLDDPRITEGFRIALEALNLMKQQAKAARTEFLVMLIPSKELVYRDAVLAQPDSVTRLYATLLENETLFRERTRAFLDAHGIRWLDVLAPLQDRLRSGPQPFPASSDGHPNTAGQRAIAEAAFAELQRLGLLDRRE